MQTTFSRITTAHQALTAAGFTFAGHGKLAKGAEVYRSGEVVALIRRVPFGGFKVCIGGIQSEPPSRASAVAAHFLASHHEAVEAA